MQARGVPAVPWLSVALLSASALAYEILLTRLFSLTHWHHLVSMIISLALLGYGASGAFLALAGHRLQAQFPAAFTAHVALFAVAAPLCFAAAQALPFNALALVWEPLNWLWFAAIYLVLSLPFLAAANAIALALWHDATRLHRVYAADLIGAGAGALGIVALLFLVPPGEALRTITAAGLACTAAAAWQTALAHRVRVIAAAMAGLSLLWTLPGAWFTPQPSVFKALPQALSARGAEIIVERSTPLGVLTVVRNDLIPFRMAPGMSLGSGRQPPPQLGLFRDSELAGPVTLATVDADQSGYLDALPSALPYDLLGARGIQRPRVFIPGAGTGEMVRQASRFDAARIEVAEHDPALLQLLTRDLAALTANPFEDAIVHPVAARAFTAANHGGFDLVQVSSGDGGSAGLKSLGPSRDLTREAFAEYLDLLSPHGLLAVTHPLQAPPRTLPRLMLTAIESLEARDLPPARHLVMIRAFRTATLVVSIAPIDREVAEAAREFSKARGFDLVYLPGLERREANRYNLLPEPALFDAMAALLGKARDDYVRDHDFRIEPVSDDRPFLYHALRLETLTTLWHQARAGGAAQFEWGYLILLATLFQAALLSLLLILVPTLAATRQGEDPLTPGAGPSRLRVVLYFGAVGLAFLYVEIAFIHSLQRLLHDPVFAVSAVLASFLTFAGLGSRLAPATAGWLQWRTRQARPWPVFLGIGIAAMLPLALLPALIQWSAEWLLWTRFLLAILLVAPLAFLMGMPFPLGLSRVASASPRRLALAWAVNGCLSVIGAIAAEMTALAAGFNVTVMVGTLLYLAAASVMPAAPPAAKK